MTFTINKYLKSTIKAPRNSANTCPKLTRASKLHDRHCYGIPVSCQIWADATPNSMFLVHPGLCAEFAFNELLKMLVEKKPTLTVNRKKNIWGGFSTP